MEKKIIKTPTPIGTMDMPYDKDSRIYIYISVAPCLMAGNIRVKVIRKWKEKDK